MKNDKVLKVTDVNTGERIKIESATPHQISEYLTDINYTLKKLKRLDVAIKRYVKEMREVEYEENAQGTLEGHFGNHKLVKSYRTGFDSSRFERMATEDEKVIVEKADRIRQAYQKMTEIITFK